MVTQCAVILAIHSKTPFTVHKVLSIATIPFFAAALDEKHAACFPVSAIIVVKVTIIALCCRLSISFARR